MASPYRVLAYALECGDRRLAALLTRRLFPAPRAAPPAAWRTLSRIATALDLP